MASLDMGRALTFGATAEEYARWRPGYPDDAVAFLAPSAPAVVADIGAGTGQLTAALLRRGMVVHSVEPDPEMLRVLVRDHPTALPHLAGADAIPLADASLDAVLVATAFHWFPFDESVAEIRRVLVPGGWLGLVYNVVVPIDPWEMAVAELDPDRKIKAGLPSWRFPAGEIVTASFRWERPQSPLAVRNNFATSSAVARLPQAERDRLLDDVEASVRRACDEGGRDSVPMHYDAFCLKWLPLR
jgi:SAM-dependent methyltransferase